MFACSFSFVSLAKTATNRTRSICKLPHAHSMPVPSHPPSYPNPVKRKPAFSAYSLLPLMLLAGCAASPSTATAPANPGTGISGNWQIQTGPALNTSALVLLTGALQTEGTVATATMVSRARWSGSSTWNEELARRRTGVRPAWPM